MFGTQRKESRAVKFTERLLAHLPPPEEGKEKVEWTDAATTGLRFVVTSTGKGRWLFRFTMGGVKRSMTLGPYPAVGLVEARKKALEAQAKVAKGEDPSVEVEQKKSDLTLAQFVEAHFWPHQRSVRKAWKDDVYAWTRIGPLLGKKRLREITRHDVVKVRNAVKEATSEPTANRHLSSLARCLSLASLWDYTDANVAKGVEKFKETGSRETFLTPDENRALDAALLSLADTELAVPATAVRLLLWTGLRRGEATSALWEDASLDADTPTLYLRNPKSKKSRSVPLNSLAVEVLQSAKTFRAKGNPFIFPSTASMSGHVKDLRAAWKKAKEMAKLPAEMHLHGLRHSYASGIANSGISLFLVQKLLGHSSSQMTQRYSHLGQDTLRQAAEVAVARMANGEK